MVNENMAMVFNLVPHSVIKYSHQKKEPYSFFYDFPFKELVNF